MIIFCMPHSIVNPYKEVDILHQFVSKNDIKRRFLHHFL